MNSLKGQIARFGAVGVVNTLITFFVIAALTYARLNPVVSNAVGYICGLINSFFMNRYFTFRAGVNQTQKLRFFISFIAAYGINLIALITFNRLSQINFLLPQLTSMLFYNMAFFILMKEWVFQKNG